MPQRTRSIDSGRVYQYVDAVRVGARICPQNVEYSEDCIEVASDKLSNSLGVQEIVVESAASAFSILSL